MSDEEKKEMPFITKALIIAIIAVFVVVFSAGIAFFVTTTAIKNSNLTQKTEESTAKKTEEHAEKAMGKIINFGEYTLNLNEPEPTFLVCQISFQMEPEEVDPKAKKTEKKAASGGHGEAAATTETANAPEGEMAEKLIILQDKVQGILRSKSKADLAADPSLEGVKKQIKDDVNGMLTTQKIAEVYFGKWMIQ